ncbi:MAG: hypothetical protein CL534_24135 [Ahrensia sp.]|nr:hypothetical protein [Ahrensia sp.]
MSEYEFFDLGRFPLQKGVTLPEAKLGFVALGSLNAARDNVILCPTWFSGTPLSVAETMTGTGRAMDPEKYFIVIPNQFGAAVSSSPSNTPAPYDRARFPRITTYDNVEAQHRLLTERFGIERIRLVSSWSMGASQSYAWAAAYPDMVEAIAPISGSARTAVYNRTFLASLKAALTNDAAYENGFYTDRPPIDGIRALAAIYAGWGFSEPFYREGVYKSLGAENLEQFIELFWESFYLNCDVNDLLAQLWTWWNNDLSDHPAFDGDFDAALGAIKARTIILNAETDRYFPPIDSEYEASRIPHAESRPIPTVWGHMAPINPGDQEFIDTALRELLT